MKRSIITMLLFAMPLIPAKAFNGGFVGGGGFSCYFSSLNLDPINEELKTIGMPQLDGVVFFYGGQVFAHLNYHLRIGAAGFEGGSRVNDYENGYSREAVFRLGWGGALLEYVFYETGRFEFYGGSSFGWGRASLTLEKRSDPINWDDIWNSYQPVPGSEDNITSTIKHSFFLAQPRVGVRYYLNNWLALCGSVDLSLIYLRAGGWTASGNDVYGAPDLNLVTPFFLFGILIGG